MRSGKSREYGRGGCCRQVRISEATLSWKKYASPGGTEIRELSTFVQKKV
jgi:hypothetical protein